jgi:hypothetical protein
MFLIELGLVVVSLVAAFVVSRFISDWFVPWSVDLR